MYLSDEERQEMKQDGLNPKRREEFLVAEKIAPLMTFDVYLLWLTEMARLSPQPPRTNFIDYKRNLL